MDNDKNKSSDDDNIIEFAKRKEQQAKASSNSNPPAVNIPPFTLALLSLTVGVYLVQYFSPLSWDYWLVTHFGFVPAEWSGEKPFTLFSALSLFGHLFLHGSWMHLLMNVFMLVAFGSGLEKSVGQRHMFLIYLFSAFGGVLTQFLFNTASAAPMIGASGAISGLFGAILIVLQKNGNLGQGTTIKPFIFLWIGISVVFGLMGSPSFGSEGGTANIAWAAHIGGFLAGLAYMKLSFK